MRIADCGIDGESNVQSPKSNVGKRRGRKKFFAAKNAQKHKEWTRNRHESELNRRKQWERRLGEVQSPSVVVRLPSTLRFDATSRRDKRSKVIRMRSTDCGLGNGVGHALGKGNPVATVQSAAAHRAALPGHIAVISVISVITQWTPSLPFARPSRACGFAPIPFAASQAAQVTGFAGFTLFTSGTKITKITIFTILNIFKNAAAVHRPALRGWEEWEPRDEWEPIQLVELSPGRSNQIKVLGGPRSL
jgi:hypothetical protein